MNVHMTEDRYLRFPSVPGPALYLPADIEGLRELVTEARRTLHDPARASERAAWAAVAVLASAQLGEPFEPTSDALEALVDWGRTDPACAWMFWDMLHRIDPTAVTPLATAILSPRPGSVGMMQRAYLAVHGEHRATLQRIVATHPMAEVREYFFAMIGKHRRLLPPGSIKNDDFDPDVLAQILATGLDDPVPAVRERAIAAAYGRGAVAGVREQVLRCLDDEEMDVRQYAIVALGVLADDESRARLLEELEHGTKAEVTSAIFALARRRDGLERVLAMADDQRDWVRASLLEAIAEVSAPMSDDRIAALEATVTASELPRVIERHLARTRRGAPEYGPDGGWFVVRHDVPEPDAPTSR